LLRKNLGLPEKKWAKSKEVDEKRTNKKNSSRDWRQRRRRRRRRRRGRRGTGKRMGDLIAGE
jgi:hypothetical protein